MFQPGLDKRISTLSMKYAGPRAQQFIHQRGYVNPQDPEVIVLCIDEAQFMNFPPPDQPANLHLGGLQDGEHILIAAQDIAIGDELTVPPESDADYQRKMESYGQG